MSADTHSDALFSLLSPNWISEGSTNIWRTLIDAPLLDGDRFIESATSNTPSLIEFINSTAKLRKAYDEARADSSD